MNTDYFRTIWDYSYWARDRLLRAAEGIAGEEYASPNGFVYGSLRGILVHTLAAEYVWFARIDGSSPPLLTEAELPTLAALRQRWSEQQERVLAYLAGLTDDGLQAAVAYTSTSGVAYRHQVWQIMAHITNHSTHHRSEAAEALTRSGRSPGDLDLIEYFRARQWL